MRLPPAIGDLRRVLLPKAFIPLRGMGHFSLSALANKIELRQACFDTAFLVRNLRFARLPSKLKCPPDFVRKAFVRGMRFELALYIN